MGCLSYLHLPEAGFAYHFVKPISEEALRLILTEVSAAIP
jgi:hypothetical protein